MTLLTLDNLTISHMGRTILEAIHLNLRAGECVSIIGPSGCGKTTLLQTIAGITPADTGNITRRYQRISYLFQQPRLLPWRNAIDNLTLLPNTTPERAAQLLNEVALSPVDHHKYPDELSGGMQQRVALARALIHRPDLLLMDEPFSALDYHLRQQLQNRIRIAIEQGLAVLLVSHDHEETLRLATTILRLDGNPAQITHRLDLPTPYTDRDQHYINTHRHHPIFSNIEAK